MTFSVGDRLKCRYKGGSNYYWCNISVVNLDGTYDVDWEDGDSQDRQGHAASDFKVEMPKPEDTDFFVGDRVKCIYLNGNSYNCTLEHANDDGTFNVIWDDGDAKDRLNHPPSDFVEVLSQVERPDIESGDEISVRITDGGGKVKWVRGMCVEVMGDVYKVTYDHDPEADVHEAKLSDLKLAGQSRFKKGSFWQDWHGEYQKANKIAEALEAPQESPKEYAVGSVVVAKYEEGTGDDAINGWFLAKIHLKEETEGVYAVEWLAPEVNPETQLEKKPSEIRQFFEFVDKETEQNVVVDFSVPKRLTVTTNDNKITEATVSTDEDNRLCFYGIAHGNYENIFVHSFDMVQHSHSIEYLLENFHYMDTDQFDCGVDEPLTSWQRMTKLVWTLRDITNTIHFVLSFKKKNEVEMTIVNDNIQVKGTARMGYIDFENDTVWTKNYSKRMSGVQDKTPFFCSYMSTKVKQEEVWGLLSQLRLDGGDDQDKMKVENRYLDSILFLWMKGFTEEYVEASGILDPEEIDIHAFDAVFGEIRAQLGALMTPESIDKELFLKFAACLLGTVEVPEPRRSSSRAQLKESGFKVGMRVRGNYKNSGQFYDATIVEAVQGGKFLIKWDDNDPQDRVKSPDQMQVIISLSLSKDVVMPVKSKMPPVLIRSTWAATEWNLECPFHGLFLRYGVLYGMSQKQISLTSATITMTSETEDVANLEIPVKTKEIAQNIRYGRYNCVQFALGARSGMMPTYDNHPERWKIRPKLPDWFDIDTKTGELKFLGPSVEVKGKLQTFTITAITENVGSQEVEVAIGGDDKSLSGLWKCAVTDDIFFQMLVFMKEDLSFTGRIHLTGEDDHIDMPDTLRRLLERAEDFRGTAELVDDVLTIRQPFAAELVDMNTIEVKSRSGQMTFSRNRFVDMKVSQQFVESTKLIVSGMNPFGSNRWLVQLICEGETLWLNPLTGLLSNEKSKDFYFTRGMWENGIPLNVDFNTSYTLQVIMEVHGEEFMSARSTIRSFQKPFSLGEIVDYANTPFWIRNMLGEGQKLELVPVYLSTTSPVSLLIPEVDVFKRWLESLNLNRYLVRDNMTCSEKSPFGKVVKILKVTGDDVLVKDETESHKILAPWHLYPRNCEVPVAIRVLRKHFAGGNDHVLNLRRIRVLGKDLETRYTLKSLDSALLCDKSNPWIFSIPHIDARLADPSNLENDLEFLSAHVPHFEQDRFLLPGAEILFDLEKEYEDRRNHEFRVGVIKEKTADGFEVAVGGDDNNVQQIVRDRIKRIIKYSDSVPTTQEARRDNLWVTFAVHGAWDIEDIGRVEIWSGSKPETMVGCSVQLLYENNVVHEFQITTNQAVYAFSPPINLQEFLNKNRFFSKECIGAVKFGDHQFKVTSEAFNDSKAFNLDGTVVASEQSSSIDKEVEIECVAVWSSLNNPTKEEREETLKLTVDEKNLFWNGILITNLAYVVSTKYLTNGRNYVECKDDCIEQLKSLCDMTNVTLDTIDSFKVGDRVRGCYTDSRWYLATISEVSEEKIVIDWDDGDSRDKDKTLEKIIPIIEMKELEFFPGDQVKCERGSSSWNRTMEPATIVSKNEDGTYMIDWHDSYYGEPENVSASSMVLIKRGLYLTSDYVLPEALTNDGNFMKLVDAAQDMVFASDVDCFEWARKQTDFDRSLHLIFHLFPKASVSALVGTEKTLKLQTVFGINASNSSSILIYLLQDGIYMYARSDGGVFMKGAPIPTGLVTCKEKPEIDSAAGRSYYQIMGSDYFVSKHELMMHQSCWFFVNPELNQKMVPVFSKGNSVHWKNDLEHNAHLTWIVEDVMGNDLIKIKNNDVENIVDIDELKFAKTSESKFEEVEGKHLPSIGVCDALLHRGGNDVVKFNWYYYVIYAMNVSNHVINMETIHVMVQEECKVQLFMTPSSSEDKDDFSTWQSITIDQQYPISRNDNGVTMCLHIQNAQLFSKIAVEIMVTTDSRTLVGDVAGSRFFNDSFFYAKGCFCGNQFDKDYGKNTIEHFPYFFVRYSIEQPQYDPIQHVQLVIAEDIEEDKDFFQMIPWRKEEATGDQKGGDDVKPTLGGVESSSHIQNAITPRKRELPGSNSKHDIPPLPDVDSSDLVSIPSSKRESRKLGGAQLDPPSPTDFDRARIRSASRARRPSNADEAMTPGFGESLARRTVGNAKEAGSVGLEQLWGGESQWRFSEKNMLFEYKEVTIMEYESQDVLDIYTNLLKHFIASKKSVLDMKFLYTKYDDDATEEQTFEDFWITTLAPILNMWKEQLKHKTIRLFCKAAQQRKLVHARKQIYRLKPAIEVNENFMLSDETLKRWWFSDTFKGPMREFLQHNAYKFYEKEPFKFQSVEKEEETGALVWTRPKNWAVLNKEHPFQSGGCLIVENHRTEDVLLNDIHIIVKEPCEIKLFKSKHGVSTFDLTQGEFTLAYSKKIERCWEPVKLSVDTIVKTCGHRLFVILCSSPSILLNSNWERYYEPDRIAHEGTDIRMSGTLESANYEKDKFNISSNFSKTGCGSLASSVSISLLAPSVGDEGAVISEKEDDDLQWIVDQRYMSLFNAFVGWQVGERTEVCYAGDGRYWDSFYWATVESEEENGLWLITWDDGANMDRTHASVDFKAFEASVIHSYEPVNINEKTFMRMYGVNGKSWSEIIPGCTDKKTWRQFFMSSRVLDFMSVPDAIQSYDKEVESISDELKAVISEFKPPTKSQLEIYKKIHSVDRKEFFNKRVQVIAESGLGERFLKVQLMGRDLVADWPAGLLIFKLQPHDKGKDRTRLKELFDECQSDLEIQIMAMHLIDGGYGRKFVREYLKKAYPESNFDSILNPNFTGPVELEYLCNHIVRVKNIDHKNVAFDLVLISKDGTEEQYMSDGTVRQRAEATQPWLVKQGENNRFDEIVREQRLREDHFLQVRANNGYRSQWQLLVTLPNDISPGEIVMIEEDGVPRTANVVCVNPNGTIQYTTFETEDPEVCDIGKVNRADINRFNIFHGGFENLLYRGCKQFMLENRFTADSRIKVWDSTKNEVMTTIGHPVIQNYYIADFNGLSEIYILTKTSVEVYNMGDFEKPLFTFEITLGGKEICVADRILYTVDEDMDVIRFDMNENVRRKRKSVIPNTNLPAKSTPSAILHMEIGSRELLAIAVQGVLRMVYIQGKSQLEADDLSEERATWSHPKYFHVHGIKRIGRFLYSGHQRGQSNLSVNNDMLLRWDLLHDKKVGFASMWKCLYGEEVFDLEVIQVAPGENLLMSGHHYHVMVWGEEGEKLERINFFQTIIDSISYCAESQSLIAGNETGYVEQILFTGGTIKVVELDGVSSICNQEDRKLMCCLTSSHLVLVDLDSRERGKSLEVSHENGSISNVKRDYICLWDGKRAELYHIRDEGEGFVQVGTSIVARGFEFMSRDIHGSIFYSKDHICLGDFVFGHDSASVVDKKFLCPGMKKCARSKNGKFLVAATESTIHVWEINSGRLLVSKEFLDDPSSFCVSSKGEYVFIIISTNEFIKLDVKRRKIEPKVFLVEDEVEEGLKLLALDATWNGHYIFGYTNDDRVIIWDERTTERVFCVFCDSEIKSMHLSTYHCVINQNNGQTWVLDTGRITWDVKYQGRLLSFSMCMKDYDVNHFASILNLSDTYQCWKQRCVIERLIMADEYDLMEKLFLRDPEVAVQQNLIALANQHQKDRCLEALLNAIIWSIEQGLHKNLENPELDIMREIVRAAETFPDQLKAFLSKLPMVKLDAVNGSLEKAIRRGSPSPKLDPAQPIWIEGKDYVASTTFITKNRLPLRNMGTLDTIRYFIKANDPELFHNICMKHALGYLWSRLKWTFFKEMIAYALFLCLWVWFAHRAISYSEDEEENEIQNLTKQDDPQVLVIIVAILLLTVYFLYNEGLQLIGSIYEAYEIKEEDDKSGVVPVSQLKVHQILVDFRIGADRTTTLEIEEAWHFDNKLTKLGDLRISHDERSQVRVPPLQRPISRQFTEEEHLLSFDSTPVVGGETLTPAQLTINTSHQSNRSYDSGIEMTDILSNPRGGLLTTWEGGGEVLYDKNSAGWMVNFESRIGSIYGTTPLTSGKIYFEIRVIDIPKFFRVGWIALPNKYKLVPTLGSGKEEWAFDGYLAEKLHDCDTGGPDFARPLVDGDVLGMLVDIEGGNLKLNLNGEEFMDMFTNCDFVRANSRNPGIVPAVSGIDGIVLWIFDEENMKYKPDDEDIKNLKVANDRGLPMMMDSFLSSNSSRTDDILRRKSVTEEALQRTSSVHSEHQETIKRKKIQRPLRERIPGYTLFMGLYSYLWSWNLVDLVVFISVIITLYHWFHKDRNMLGVWAAFTSLAAFTNTLYYSRGIKESSVVVRILLAIMVEIKYFLGIVLIVVLGFSIAFRWLGSSQESSEAFGGLWIAITNTFNMGILGDTEPLDEVRGWNEPVKSWGELIFILMDFMLLILMLNAVIAYMGDSYNKVRDVSEAWSLNQRAALLQEFLGNMAPSKRKELEQESQWLHVLSYRKPQKKKEGLAERLTELQSDVMTAHEKQIKWFRSLETMVSELKDEIKSLKTSSQTETRI